MIKITFEDERTLTISGHAGYAEQGKDIVCAGVSAIAYTLLGYLEDIGVDVLSDIKPKKGYMRILSRTRNKTVRDAFKMAQTGLLQIERAFPEYVSIKK